MSWDTEMEASFREQFGKTMPPQNPIMTDDEYTASEEIKAAWDRLCLNPNSPTALQGIRYWQGAYVAARDIANPENAS